ncbi:MAG: DUF2029 domain-containing protein [Leptonema sp. (in: Bacteria)]|nr:DUF2029 domain-containing protein [Leptonema sp. (in: bacteria)]
MKDQLIKSLKTSVQWLQTRTGLKIVIAVVLLTFANQSTAILKSGLRYNFQSRSDFEDYYEASKRLSTNEDLYRVESIKQLIKKPIDITDISVEELLKLLLELKSTGAYLYPPFFAWTLTPLSYVSYKSAAIIYQLASIFALILFLMFFWRLLRSLHPSKERSLVIALLLYSPFLSSNVSNGNVGFFLLLLCGIGLLWSFHIGFFSGLRSNRFVFEFCGGFLLGLATIIKIMPAFVTGVLAAGRRYLGLVGFVVGIAFSVLVPATTIGFTNNIDKHQEWYSFLIENYQKYSVVRPYANNQTISAAISKLMIAGSDQKQEKYGLPLISVDLNHSQPLIITIRILNLGFISALAFLILFLWWRKPISVKAALTDTNFSALISVSLLTALVSSGVSWYHTYSLLLIPLTLRLSQPPMSRAEQFAYLAPAVLAIIFAILPNRLYEAVSLYSLYTWVACASIVLHHISLWRYVFFANTATTNVKD